MRDPEITACFTAETRSAGQIRVREPCTLLIYCTVYPSSARRSAVISSEAALIHGLALGGATTTADVSTATSCADDEALWGRLIAILACFVPALCQPGGQGLVECAGVRTSRCPRSPLCVVLAVRLPRSRPLRPVRHRKTGEVRRLNAARPSLCTTDRGACPAVQYFGDV